MPARAHRVSNPAPLPARPGTAGTPSGWDCRIALEAEPGLSSMRLRPPALTFVTRQVLAEYAALPPTFVVVSLSSTWLRLIVSGGPIYLFPVVWSRRGGSSSIRTRPASLKLSARATSRHQLGCQLAALSVGAQVVRA